MAQMKQNPALNKVFLKSRYERKTKSPEEALADNRQLINTYLKILNERINKSVKSLIIATPMPDFYPESSLGLKC